MTDTDSQNWDIDESQEQRYSTAPLPTTSDSYNLRDRMDILNLMALYGHLFDSGYRTAWLETVFAPDVIWTLSPQPSVGRNSTSVMRGREEIKTWFTETPRAYLTYVENQGLDPEQATVFHSVQDIGIIEQTSETVKIVANEFVGVKHPGLSPTFHHIGIIRIEGELRKNTSGRWQVTDWNLL